MDKSIDKKKKENYQLQLLLFRYYKLITAVLIMLIVVGGYYLILRPKYEQVGLGGQYNLETLEKERAKRQAYLQNLKELIANYQKVNQADIDKLKKILPAEKDIPGLFVQLQALTEKYNLLLAGININEAPAEGQENKTPGEIKRLNVSLNLIGLGGDPYAEVKEFLSGLEYNLRLFDINAVYFSPDSPVYSVNLFTYYY